MSLIILEKSPDRSCLPVSLPQIRVLLVQPPPGPQVLSPEPDTRNQPGAQPASTPAPSSQTSTLRPGSETRKGNYQVEERNLTGRGYVTLLLSFHIIYYVKYRNISKPFSKYLIYFTYTLNKVYVYGRVNHCIALGLLPGQTEKNLRDLRNE